MFAPFLAVFAGIIFVISVRLIANTTRDNLLGLSLLLISLVISYFTVLTSLANFSNIIGGILITGGLFSFLSSSKLRPSLTRYLPTLSFLIPGVFAIVFGFIYQ